MASNFHIISYKDGDSRYLSLSGDFDERSAHELINKLTKNGNGSWDIFIDTNNLKTIHPFDTVVLQKIFSSIINQLKNIMIVGTNKYKFEQIWSSNVN